jgi:hypothetical protein
MMASDTPGPASRKGRAALSPVPKIVVGSAGNSEGDEAFKIPVPRKHRYT